MDIPQLMQEFRELKTEMDALKARMDEVRAQIEPLVESQGDWSDAHGYARFTVYQPSVSYDQKVVRSLQEAWAGSEDPIMRSCGDILRSHRTEKLGRRVLRLK